MFNHLDAYFASTLDVLGWVGLHSLLRWRVGPVRQAAVMAPYPSPQLIVSWCFNYESSRRRTDNDLAALTTKPFSEPLGRNVGPHIRTISFCSCRRSC